MYLYCKWQIVLFHIFFLLVLLNYCKEKVQQKTHVKRDVMIQSNHSRILNTVCKHAVFYVVFTFQCSKPQKISKTPLNNYTSIVQRTEYCSQVSCFIETGSIVKCIMFSLKSSRQIHAITLS